METVRVAFAVTVVLVYPKVLPRAQCLAHGLGRPGDHPLTGLVVQRPLQRIEALGTRVFGMGVIDVETGAVGEHDVDQTRVDLDRSVRLVSQASGIASR